MSTKLGDLRVRVGPSAFGTAHRRPITPDHSLLTEGGDTLTTEDGDALVTEVA